MGITGVVASTEPAGRSGYPAVVDQHIHPPVPPTPLLLTRTSTRPYRSSTIPAIASTPAGSVTSAGATNGSPPKPVTASAVASRPSLFRAASTTVSPAAANAAANSRPIPWLAPVTTTTRRSLTEPLHKIGRAHV